MLQNYDPKFITSYSYTRTSQEGTRIMWRQMFFLVPFSDELRDISIEYLPPYILCHYSTSGSSSGTVQA